MWLLIYWITLRIQGDWSDDLHFIHITHRYFYVNAKFMLMQSHESLLSHRFGLTLDHILKHLYFVILFEVTLKKLLLKNSNYAQFPNPLRAESGKKKSEKLYKFDWSLSTHERQSTKLKALAVAINYVDQDSQTLDKYIIFILAVEWNTFSRRQPQRPY